MTDRTKTPEVEALAAKIRTSLEARRAEQGKNFSTYVHGYFMAFLQMGTREQAEAVRLLEDYEW